jgi:hypothetical protein
METKEFTFTMKYSFIADNEQEALERFQEMLDDSDWGKAVLDADNWNIEEEDVAVSEAIIEPEPMATHYQDSNGDWHDELDEH